MNIPTVSSPDAVTIDPALEIEAKDALWAAFQAAGGSIKDVPVVANKGLLRYCVAKANPQLVDCDEQPSIPSGLKIAEEKHQIQSRMRGLVDPSEVKLHLDSAQEKGNVRGELLKKALEGQPVMTAKLLDHYMAHPGEIPESWKGQAVFFWGTIYADCHGNLYVRYLHWNGDRWCEYYDYLDYVWDASDPALLSASTPSAAQPG